MRAVLFTIARGVDPTTAPAEDSRRRATGVAAGVRTDGARVAAKLLVDLAGGERSQQPG
jgi:hypothetical protein